MDRKRTANIWTIDLLRWVSAMLVMLGHIRNNLFVDHDQLTHSGLLFDFFYFASGFGHQAVIVFFVLSGYLVGGGLWLQFSNGSSSGTMRDYYVHRFSRIYIVLLPAIIVTGLLDGIGATLFAATHTYDVAGWSESLNFAVASRAGAGTFLCNIANLQGAFCTTYGSNGPLWSLSYEWFYYLTFPSLLLLARLIGRVQYWRSPAVRRGAALLGIVAVLLIGNGLLSPFRGFIAYYPIWLIGVLARMAIVTRPLSGRAAFVAIPLFGVVLAASRVGLPLAAADYAVGLSTAVLLTVERIVRFDGFWPRLNEGLAAFSYSLYAIHFPIVVFTVAGLRAAGIFDRRLQPGTMAFTLLMLLGVFVGCCGWAFSLATERHTGKLRRLVSAAISPAAAAPPRLPQ